MRVVVLVILFVVSFGESTEVLSWAEAAALISDPARYSLVDGNVTYGALTDCSGPYVFDEHYNVSWLFDGDTLVSFIGQGGASMLRAVGLSEQVIKIVAAANNSCIIWFETNLAVPSTWKGLVSLLPSASASKIAPFVDGLATRSFSDIMGNHVSNVLENYLEPVLDAEALSWTQEKFEASSSVDLFAARSFLYNYFQASNLFLGDGTSFNSNWGHARGLEFVAPKLLKSKVGGKMAKIVF